MSFNLSGSLEEQESYKVLAYLPDFKFLYLNPSLFIILSTCSKCSSSSLARGERDFAKLKCGYLCIKEIAVVAAFFSQCAWSIKRISKESKAFSIQALGVGELRIVYQVLDIKVLLGIEVSLVMGFR